MLNHAELDLDTDLNDHYRAQSAPKESPQPVSELRCRTCRTYRIKPRQSQFLSQKLHKYLHIQLKLNLQQVIQSQASFLTSKTSFKLGTSLNLSTKRVSSPSLKNWLFNTHPKQAWARRSIFLTNPLSQARSLKTTFVCAGEPSQSYRGIYEQTNFNQCNARRRGLGNLCGEWYS